MAGRSDITPVVRVDVKALGSRNLRRTIGDVATLLESNTECQFRGLQLDVDCPERRLGEYTDLLKWLTGKLPASWDLSITALPCHLDRKECRNLIRTVDYYVLQVHGLAVPDHCQQEATLMDPEIVRRAINRARKLGHPFRVALPCYGYMMFFDGDSGAFSHLSAEGPEAKTGDMLTRILQPDPGQTAALVREVRAESARGPCRGIVWFRLPVPGDRLAWDRKTLRTVQEGKVPEVGCQVDWSKTANGTWELSIRNRGILGEREATVHLDWGENRGSGDVFQPYTGNELIPGVLPTAIRGPLPRPGMDRKIAWFRLAVDELPKCEAGLGSVAFER